MASGFNLNMPERTGGQDNIQTFSCGNAQEISNRIIRAPKKKKRTDTTLQTSEPLLSFDPLRAGILAVLFQCFHYREYEE